jgi:hypothetical protein
MAEALDEKTRAILAAYLRGVRTLPNEAAKRQRFAALLGELFPGQKLLTEFARGSARLVRTRTADGTRRGAGRRLSQPYSRRSRGLVEPAQRG